jgi:hypothetical protein
MANWQFTDQYAAAFPGLNDSILATLIFDVPEGTSPVTGTTFSAPLDLAATGTVMNVLSSLVGLQQIPMTGTVTTTNNTLTITLQSSNGAQIVAALAQCIPIVGGNIMQSASVNLNNVTPAAPAADAPATTDTFEIRANITVSGRSLLISAQVPMSEGTFTLQAEPQNFGVALSDLNFLLGGGGFAGLFPTTLPASWYSAGSTQLQLLTIGLSLYVVIKPKLSITVSNLLVGIGITNIPLYPNALFLNPLAVWLTIANPTSSPSVTAALSADALLYPYGQQTNPPTAKPDFTFGMHLQLPGKDDQTFSVSGNFDNPFNLPVSTIISDFMNSGGFNTGIGSNITLDALTFFTSANTATGTISAFNLNIAMSSPVGLFATPDFGVQDFSITIDYTS